MRIFLVEDDGSLGDALCKGLKQYGYTVDWLTDGRTALSAIKTESFDIIILDLNLPRLSGLSLLREIRAAGITTPVLVLTARDSLEDRIKGLDSGADDYHTKPFDLEELSARIRALHRRHSSNRAAPLLTYRDIELDPSSFSVTLKGQAVNLSRREFSLLQKLLENAGHVLSRDSLNQCLYGWDDEIDSNTLEVHIHNLRKKLAGINFIRTIRGVGYMAEKENH